MRTMKNEHMKWKSSLKREKEEVLESNENEATKSDPLFNKKKQFYTELFSDVIPNPSNQTQNPNTSNQPKEKKISQEQRTNLLNQRFNLRKKMFKEKTHKGQPIMNNYVNFLLFELENQEKLKK